MIFMRDLSQNKCIHQAFLPISVFVFKFRCFRYRRSFSAQEKKQNRKQQIEYNRII